MNNKLYDKLIFDHSVEGRVGYSLPNDEYAGTEGLSRIPASLLRAKPLNLPEVDEPTVVRHYTNSSTNNFGVDSGFYPLGSCTMKYNPKISEEIAAMPAFTSLHPMQAQETVQGALAVYYELQAALSEIAGLAEFTLNPFAGLNTNGWKVQFRCCCCDDK